MQETLKVSLGPFVDKFNSSREQFNVVSDLLKQLPEYKDLIKQNTLLLDENTSLKNYIKEHCKPDNHIELKIIEKEPEIKKEEVEIEQVGGFADRKLRAKYTGNEACIDPNCEDEDFADESILDMALTRFKSPRQLLYHYRSQHEDLINFSNDEFYNNLIIPDKPFAS